MKLQELLNGIEIIDIAGERNVWTSLYCRCDPKRSPGNHR